LTTLQINKFVERLVSSENNVSVAVANTHCQLKWFVYKQH